MRSGAFSVRADGGAAYRRDCHEYFSRLVAPMDDMWVAFADLAVPYALLADDEVAGSAAADRDGQLLRFFVRPRFQRHSTALLRALVREAGVTRLIVATLDPGYLAAALDLASGVEPHSLLFAAIHEPEVAGLDGLRPGETRDHERIVEFQRREIGAPRDFVERYTRERLERGEIVLFEKNARLECLGELRRDRQQAGVTHLGVIVRGTERRRGLGSRMLASLVAHSRARGFSPHCSTEVTNLAARRAIERAGFVAQHRLLRVRVEPEP